MAIELWDSRDLFMLQRDDRLDPLPSYFLDTFFTETFFSDDEKIRFGKLPTADRVLAPFVLPTEAGKPIFKRKGETISDFTPPYIKPKDAVRAEDARNVLPSEVFRNGGQRPTLAQRFEQRVAEITQYHLRAIRVRELWMAARAFIDGKVQIDYERDQGAASPSVLLDFGRDAGHTVVLGGGFQWDDPEADILGDLESWMTTMYLATFGGTAAQLIVGASVAKLFRNNVGIKDQLDTRYRGGDDVTISRGIMRTVQPLNRIGSLGSGLEVYTYRDQVQNANGTMVDILDPRDVLLIAPGATGVRAYGAIMDDEALQQGLSSVDIYPKMWSDKDPGATYLMHQSSPLPIPLYPNRTFKARVIA
ncbi:MAG: hypothetical protein DI537_19150 [Stutzerimonas stutzeri]|nr:MAG: hypothetical protein DI537_19150 [Stutzerimonas stutzeri]